MAWVSEAWDFSDRNLNALASGIDMHTCSKFTYFSEEY